MKKIRVLLLSVFALTAGAALTARATEANGTPSPAGSPLFCARKCEQVERNCIASGGDPQTCDAAFNACQDACLSAGR